MMKFSNLSEGMKSFHISFAEILRFLMHLKTRQKIFSPPLLISSSLTRLNLNFFDGEEGKACEGKTRKN